MTLCGLWALCWGITLAGGRLGGGATAVAVFALAMVVFAIGETLLSPTLAPMVNDLAPDELRGRYNGVSTLAWTTGYMAGPVLGGRTGRVPLVWLTGSHLRWRRAPRHPSFGPKNTLSRALPVCRSSSPCETGAICFANSSMRSCNRRTATSN